MKARKYLVNLSCSWVIFLFLNIGICPSIDANGQVDEDEKSSWESDFEDKSIKFCISDGDGDGINTNVTYLFSRTELFSNQSRVFSIDPQPLNCADGVLKSIVVNHNKAISQHLNSNQGHFLSNWSIIFEGKESSTGDYCIEGIQNETLNVQICQRNSDSEDENNCSIGCIRKCCNPNEVFVLEEDGALKCTPSDNQNQNQWVPNYVYKDGNHDERISRNESSWGFHFISSHPREEWCRDDPIILSTKEYEDTTYLLRFMKEIYARIRITESGSVIVKNHPFQPWRFLQQGSFCIDGLKGSSKDLIAIDCSGPTEEIQTNLTIYAVFQAIACVFLLATVIVYSVLWERQNIHSWTLLGYAACALCLYSSLFVNYVYNYNRTFMSNWIDAFCTSLAIITHFLYISMFCWLTLINFDVYWTFGGQNLRRMTAGGSKRKRRFFMYFLFTIFAPAIVICVGISLDHFYKDDFEHLVVYPDYGGRNCYIDFQTSAAFFYMLLPAAILMGCNLIFFFLTIYTLHKISETTKFATNNSHAETAKPRFLLFIKLFFVMGLCWILEVITYFPFGTVSTNPLAVLFDIISILQPIAIFVIFVCKADVLRALQLKFPFARPIFQRFGLKQLPDRGSGGSSVSQFSTATQFSTCSSTSTRSMRSGSGNHISLETMARLNKI